jgi:hypothetical protein
MTTKIDLNKLGRLMDNTWLAPWAARSSGGETSAAPTGTTHGDKLRREMARVRQILPSFNRNPVGCFSVPSILADLDQAAKALAKGDVVEVSRVIGSLRRWRL